MTSLDGIAGLEPFWLNGKYVFDEPTHDFFGVNGTDPLILRHANEGIMNASPSISDPQEIHRKSGLSVRRFD